MAENVAGDAEHSPFKYVGRSRHPEGSSVTAGGVQFGGSAVRLIAGPASIKDAGQMLRAAQAARAAGATLFSAEVRSWGNPYREAVPQARAYLLAAAREVQLPLLVEAASAADLADWAGVAAMFRVSGRNMQNFALLQELGRARTPVLLERGRGATLEEWLLAAEYIMCGGNEAVILCCGSIESFETYTKNRTLDISAVPAVKQLSHLPVLVDAAHAGGAWLTGALAKAAVAAGADGVLVAVDDSGEQALTAAASQRLAGELQLLAAAVGRTF